MVQSFNLSSAVNIGSLTLNPLPQIFSDTVGSENIHDLYRFDLENQSILELNLDQLNANVDIFLLDTDGNIITESEQQSDRPEFIRTILESGTYYISIKSIDRIDTNYDLRIVAESVVDNQIVSEVSTTLPDPEFDQFSNQVTWQDVDGNLWVADVDPLTGKFGRVDPITGAFIAGLDTVYANGAIDTNLALQNISQGGTGNGPEWVYTPNGSQIVYTKEDEQGNRFLGIARRNGSEWDAGFLTDEQNNPVSGFLPSGTLNLDSQKPLIKYIRISDSGSVEEVWRELENPTVGGLLPGSAGRWVQAEGESAIVRKLVDPATGLKQYFKYDIYTEQLTQLTQDEILKAGGVAMMWYAPEYDSLVLLSSEKTLDEQGKPAPQRDQLGLYRQIDGVWTRFLTLSSPSEELSYIHSPEPFVYQGKSYISLVAVKTNIKGKKNFENSEVWVVGIDPDQRIAHEVSIDIQDQYFNDPESFVQEVDGSTQGFIYYTQVTPEDIRITYRTSLNSIFGLSEPSENPNPEFETNEVIVSNNPIPDPEFDPFSSQVIWQDKQEKLWIADVDPLTGEFDLAGATLIDTGLAPIPSFRQRTGTGNGPEPVLGLEGLTITYTKAFGSTQDTWEVYQAKLTENGWKTGPLPGAELLPGEGNGLNPIGTLDPLEENPRIQYFLPSARNQQFSLAWRDIQQPNGNIISEVPQSAARWVNGENSQLVYTESVNNVNQVFLYDTQTNTSTQLTFSPDNKNSPFMWWSPEYGENLLMVGESNSSQQNTDNKLGIYRNLEGTWTLINEVVLPTQKQFIRSAEPFVFNGQSYISMLAEDDKKLPSEVWIASATSEREFYRQVSDGDVSLVRNDPEAVVTEGGVFIYYTQRGSSVVYRADTGLGLPEALTLIGTGNDDELLGNAAADVITGENGDDILRGAAGSDTITGGAGNDILIGDVGDDLLNGAGYNDQGINTIDTLTGGKGTDTFILGDTNSVFYSANGRRDYALITDFNLTEDLIQLKGSLEYSATNRKNGSLLFLVDSGEEIAFLQNIRAGDLNLSNFILV